MGRYDLYAEREGCLTRLVRAGLLSKHEAKLAVERMEFNGRQSLPDAWPEGYDAVLQDLETGEKWMLADEWELMV